MQAILIDKVDGAQRATVTEISRDRLPGPDAGGEVTVRIEYSTVNYKDGLAMTGKAPVVRSFPMVPGIDFAGVVEDSTDSAWKAGDRVILNGWGVGEAHWGGLAQYARVKSKWLVRAPAAISSRAAMAIGTAGYTAMLCVQALERHGVTPGSGEILVTGASGGVGSVAIALLSKMGHTVVASTGKLGKRSSCAVSGLRRSSIATRFPHRASRLPRNAGQAWSTASARRRWPMHVRPPGIAAPSRHAAWPAAWTSRRR